MRRALAVLLLLVACDGPPARSKPWRHRVAAEPAAPDGGLAARLEDEKATAAARRRHTLRVHLLAEPTSLNPLAEPEREALWVVADSVYEALLRLEPDPSGGPARLAPALADRFEIAPTGLELRFHLRDGVRFHDGRELTAVDVQATLDEVRGERSRAPAFRAALAGVVSVEMWTPRDVRLVLARPDGYLPRVLAALPILPAPGPSEPARRKTPVGTGPYRLAAWEKGERIVLGHNETYWGPRAAIEEIEFVVEPDAARALVLAKRGELDVVPALIPEHYPEQLAVPGIAETFVRLDLRPPAFRAFAVNARRPPFDDARVRHAAELLVDRERLVDEVFHGLARPIAGPVWPGGPADGASPDVPAFDPRAAMSLLDDAGWQDLDGDGLRERAAERLRVSVLVAADGRGEKEVDAFVAALRSAGFFVEPRPGDAGAIQARLAAGDFDAALVEWRGLSDWSLQPLLGTGGSLNVGGFSSPAVDAALAQLGGAFEPAARAPAATALGRLLADEVPLLPVVAPDPRGIVHRRVRGVRVTDGWIVLRELSLDPEE